MDVPLTITDLPDCAEDALSTEVALLVDANGRLTTTEAAGIIGCSDWFVRKLYDEGKLSGIRVGNRRRIDQTSAEHYRDHGEVPPDAKA